MRKLVLLAMMLAMVAIAVYPAAAGAKDNGEAKGCEKGEAKGNPHCEPGDGNGGEDGNDGKDGKDGRDGRDGRDAIVRDFDGDSFLFDDLDDFEDLLDLFDDFEGDDSGDQDAESGDVTQTYVVSNTGDNSNQCVGGQLVANTGNVQNSGFGDASIEVSPVSGTTCDQVVNQEAYAYSY